VQNWRNPISTAQLLAMSIRCITSAEVDRIEAWNDGLGKEWRAHVPA